MRAYRDYIMICYFIVCKVMTQFAFALETVVRWGNMRALSTAV